MMLKTGHDGREKKMMEKETISPALNLAMRILYQASLAYYALTYTIN